MNPRALEIIRAALEKMSQHFWEERGESLWHLRMERCSFRGMGNKRPNEDSGEPSESSAEEFFDYIDFDDELENDRFREAVKKFKLTHYLDSVEMRRLVDVWKAANDCNFLLNAPGKGVVAPKEIKEIHDSASNRQERRFMEVFRKLRRSPGWKRIPLEIRQKLKTGIFSVKIEDENLGE